jgi:hypothetical protein
MDGTAGRPGTFESGRPEGHGALVRRMADGTREEVLGAAGAACGREQWRGWTGGIRVSYRLGDGRHSHASERS